MVKSCKKGSILRKGYSAKRGSKTIRVKSRCIKAQSQSGLKRSVRDAQIIKKKMSQHRVASKKFGVPKCPKGQMVRAGYKRKSKKSKKTSWVKPTCIKSLDSRKQARQQLFVLDKGTLSTHGYHADLSSNKRHHALVSAMNAGIKPLTAFRKLVALATLTKNSNPDVSRTYISDAKWLKTTDEYKNRQ